VRIRRFVGLALVAGMPAIAGAQFTTFIPPVAKTAADSVKAAVVAEQKVRQDSIVVAQMTNMKTWVDSAAGVAPTPRTTTARTTPPRVAPTDSIATIPKATATRTTHTDSAFANGTRAPATASVLPLLLVAGVGLIFAGVLVSRTQPRRMRVRARDRRA